MNLDISDIISKMVSVHSNTPSIFCGYEMQNSHHAKPNVVIAIESTKVVYMGLHYSMYFFSAYHMWSM